MLWDGLSAWSREFHDERERSKVYINSEDELRSNGFHAWPDCIEVYAPSTLALTPSEAVRLAQALLDAAKAAGVEPDTTR